MTKSTKQKPVAKPKKKNVCEVPPGKRPKVGLALGAGVARGWAHIGVLQRLKEEGIAIDFIAGTSIGAVVGGAAASGALDKLELWARDLREHNFFRFLDLKFNAGGLFGSTRLQEIMVEHFGDKTFEELEIPFEAVACELKSGHEVWLKEGHVIDAIKASFALPGVFEPICHEGRWLVDGALVNPVPVSLCRAAGCDMVIAVNLSEDMYGRVRASRKGLDPTGDYGVFSEFMNAPSVVGRVGSQTIFKKLFKQKNDAPSLFTNMIASLNILQNRLARARLAGDPPDITIVPRVGHIGLLEFHRTDELIVEGRRAFDDQFSQIKDAMTIINERIRP